MKKALILPLAIGATLFPLAAYAQDTVQDEVQDKVEIGRLECNVEGGVGLIIGSSKEATCNFYDAKADQPTEVYFGRVNKIGLDVGVTDATTIQWLVLAPSDNAYEPGILAGQYVGVSGEATIGVGAGANVLVGGSDKSFTLQPVSVQGQTGLNIALGITGFELHSAHQQD